MAVIKEFKYTKTGTDGLITRKLLVLNEDATRIGGFELTNATPEDLEKLQNKFKDHQVKDFSRRKKGEPKPEYEEQITYPYRAFSKAKIAEFNA